MRSNDKLMRAMQCLSVHPFDATRLNWLGWNVVILRSAIQCLVGQRTVRREALTNATYTNREDRHSKSELQHLSCTQYMLCYSCLDYPFAASTF